MRHRHPLSARETLRLQPKWRSPDQALNIEQDILPELEGPAIVAILVLIFVTFVSLLPRSLRRRHSPLPDIPWVHLEPRKCFSKLRARTWTTVNYEAALQEAYDTVCIFRPYLSMLIKIAVFEERSSLHIVWSRWGHSSLATVRHSVAGQSTRYSDQHRREHQECLTNGSQLSRATDHGPNDSFW